MFGRRVVFRDMNRILADENRAARDERTIAAPAGNRRDALLFLLLASSDVGGSLIFVVERGRKLFLQEIMRGSRCVFRQVEARLDLAFSDKRFRWREDVEIAGGRGSHPGIE